MISVIIPVYNCEKYIKKCVESVRKQSYKDIEIIVVDDGSKDNSLKVCNELAAEDNRIKVFTKPNGGASSARNFGIEQAKGEYIMFADSDDCADVDWCRVMHETQVAHNGSFVICDIFKHQITEQGETLLSEVPVETGYQKNEDFYRVIKLKVFNQPYNKIYSTQIIKDNNIRYDENLPIGEDLIFNLDYAEHCKDMYLISNKLYHYFENNSSSLCHRYHENLFEINQRIFDKETFLMKKFNVDTDVYYNEILWDYFSAHIDCLDREMMCQEHCFTERIKRMRKIMKSNSFSMCIKKCKGNISRLHYFMLSLRSPLLYVSYNKMHMLKREH